MIWVWNFILYSFFGFLLEVAYARATGGRGDRKSLLVLPLCPVYGVGACLILLLPRTVIQNPFTLFLLGGLAISCVEGVPGGHGGGIWDGNFVRAGTGRLLLGLYRPAGQHPGEDMPPLFPGLGGAGPPTHLLRPSGGGAVDRPDPAWGDLDGGRHGGSGHGGVWGADEGDWEPGLSAVVSKAGGKGTGGWLTAP